MTAQGCPARATLGTTIKSKANRNAVPERFPEAPFPRLPPRFSGTPRRKTSRQAGVRAASSGRRSGTPLEFALRGEGSWCRPSAPTNPRLTSLTPLGLACPCGVSLWRVSVACVCGVISRGGRSFRWVPEQQSIREDRFRWLHPAAPPTTGHPQPSLALQLHNGY